MVNWTTFESLPGSVTNNFEMLCRSLVWLTYSRYGIFKAQLNQPGVEFDLKLQEDCNLGKNGNHFGWQCRWYDLSSGVKIGKTRRDKIADALDKTINTIPGLTDWVLWTRYPLTKADQEWFYALNTKVKLHLWTCHEAETFLNSECEQLKQTYFGDLILRPDRLLQLHAESVEPIKKRWFPEIHQIVDAERSLRQILAHSSAWSNLSELANTLEMLYSEIGTRSACIPKNLKTLTDQFLDCLDALSKSLRHVFHLLENKEFALLQQTLTADQYENLRQVDSLPRKLRGAHLQVGLFATNAISYMKEANSFLSRVRESLNIRIVGVVAEAGGGKTQLAATLTAPESDRPAGILLLGRFLTHNSSLDDLAKKIVINGKPVASMQALLAALDAAAARARCILPLVIDGLNEAEDPRVWKILLSSLTTTLNNYPNVLVICTLRSGSPQKKDRDYYEDERQQLKPFVQHCLPEGTTTFEIPDFGDDVEDAIEKYFAHFKIEANNDLELIDYLKHPLTLRIFCEVTNPTREKIVGMEAAPRSLAALFEGYIDMAATRIEELSPYHSRYYHADIINQLNKFGELLWTSHARAINERQYRTEISDDRNLWSNSAVNFMEQEGLLLRLPGNVADQDEIVPMYDLLGGYLVAKYIISRNGRDTIGKWLKSESTLDALSTKYSKQHPLRDDIMRFLVALLPKYHNIQLWEVIEKSFYEEALELSILLEGKYMDRSTSELIATAIKKSPHDRNVYLGNLISIRGTIKHPLNANFVDEVLSELKVSERDLIWTEWLRRNVDYFHSDLDQKVKRWSSQLEKRSGTDLLNAKWIMWMLTSTSHSLRYNATLALYWFGRGDAESLFRLTVRSITIDDPYILERMLAASYGTAMSLSVTTENTSFAELITEFAQQIYDNLISDTAVNGTSHLLIMDYAKGIIELAQKFNPALLSTAFPEKNAIISKPSRKFKTSKRIDMMVQNGDSPFRMDFENYTIGTLVEGRSNYDYNHKSYQKVRSQILWRIFDLGWSGKRFASIDRAIENGRLSHSRHDDDLNKLDRYGKKYSWIAYFELKGLKRYSQEEEEIFSDTRELYADIDPSFPTPPSANRIIQIDTLGDSEIELYDWIRNGEIPNLSNFFYQANLENYSGPWVLLDGYMAQQDEHRGRGMFGFFRSFFVRQEQQEELLTLLAQQRLGGRWLPAKHEIRAVFAGEIPWSKHFSEAEPNILRFVVSEHPTEVLEEQENIYLNGIKIDLSPLDKLRLLGINLSLKISDESRLSDEEFKKIEIRKEKVLVQKQQKTTQKIKVIKPVCDLKSVGDNHFDTSTGGYTLNKNFFQFLDLSVIPQSRDLIDSKGRATFQNLYTQNSFKNSEQLFFLRKDILDELLEKLGMSMVWAVWGERELSLKQFDRIRPNHENNITYTDFQQVHKYSK